MPIIDTNLFVGHCPFRSIPSGLADLTKLRADAGLDRAVATGFDSVFQFDPVAGLSRDLETYASLADWLRFYAVVNPEFPRLEALVAGAAQDRRVAGIRLFPTLHRYSLTDERTLEAVRLAAAHALPVTLTARLFDGRVAPRAVNQTELKADEVQAFLAAADRKATIILSMFYFGELKALKVDWKSLPNVYLDLGCCKPMIEAFDTLAEWFPPERAVFGTGAPYYYWKGSRLAIEGSRLTSGQKTAILGTTAQEVLRWA